MKQCIGVEKCTFRMLHEKRPTILFEVVAANLSKRHRQIFSFEHTPDILVEDAIRASCSFPIYFQALRARDIFQSHLDYPVNDFKTEDSDIFVDGALFGSFPIDIVSKEELEGTLGIFLTNKFQVSPIDEFNTYIVKLLSTVSSTFDQHIYNQYSMYSVKIILDSSVVNPDFSQSKKEYYMREGYEQTRAYFQLSTSEFVFSLREDSIMDITVESSDEHTVEVHSLIAELNELILN